MDRSSPTVGHGTGSSSRASSTGSPILHVKAARPQLQWQAQQQQHKQKAAVGSTQTTTTSSTTSRAASPSTPSSMNKQKERTSTNNSDNNSPQQSHGGAKTNHSHSGHKIKHHHHLSGERHKHHKHRSHGLGVKSSSPGSSPLGKHRHRRHHHRSASASSSGVQRNGNSLHHSMEERKSSEDKKQDEGTTKLPNNSIGSAPASPATNTDSGSTGVFRAARELAQLRADLVEIGVDPGGEDGGSNPSTPSGRRGTGRGRGRQPVQYEEVNSWYDEDNGITYTKGDCVYLENQKTDQPYFVCGLKELRQDKKENLFATIRWYYRPSEVPDGIYQCLIHDRNTENNSGLDLAVNDPVIKSRELFISDATDTYPVAALRGRCKVIHYQDFYSIKDFVPDADTFFYVLEYNPQTKRLATTQGEIRVGPSHQARLPPYQPNVRPEEMPERLEDVEEISWRPTVVVDSDLVMYLRAARSMAAFAGMCDGGSTDDGCNAASMDETTINAMDTLHKSSYDTGKALQELVKKPVPRSIDKKWSEEETKRFVKGLRQYGKNFFRIKKDLLPHKETSDLVEYYYFWKKTPAAANNRPHRRHRRQNVFRQQRRTPRPPSSDWLDSASEQGGSENDTDDSDSRDLTGYACRHCFTTISKDWHHAGKDRALLCTECRLYYKKYGEERPVDKRGQPPPYLFKPVQEDEASNGKHAMRTRRSKESGSSKGKAGSRDRQATSSPDVPDSPLNSSVSSKDITGRSKSPSTASSCSEASTATTDKVKSKKSKETKGKKRNIDSESEDSKTAKKRKDQERTDSPTESSTDSSSVCNENDDNSNDGDVENNQDDLSSSGSSSAPSPASVVEADTTVKIATTSDNSTADDTTGEASESPSAAESPALPASPAKPVAIHPVPPAQPGLVQPPQAGAGVPLHPPPLAPLQKPGQGPPGLHPSSEKSDIKGSPSSGAPHAAAFHAVAPTQQHPQTTSSHQVVPMPGALTQAPPLVSEMQKEIKKEPGLEIKKEPGLDEMADRERERREERDRERDMRDRDPRGQGMPPQHLPPHLSQYPPHHPGIPLHGFPPGATLPPTSQVAALSRSMAGGVSRSSPPPLYQTPGSGHVPPPPPLTSGLQPSGHPPPHPHLAHHLPPGMHVPPGGTLPPHHLPVIKQEPRSESPHHRPRTPDHRSRSPYGRRSPMDTSRPPHLDSSGRPLPPLDSSYKPLPLDASGRPLPIDSRLSEEHMRSRSPHRPHSPNRPRSRSPIRARSRSRSRSRSPNADSDSEIDIPRGPTPEPRIVNEQCHKTKNAIFIKHIWRGYNTCSRCDFEFQPQPDSKLAKKREDRLRKGNGAPSSAAPSHHPPVATAPRPASSSGAPPRPSSAKDERRDDEHLRRRSEDGNRVAVSSAHPASRPTPSPNLKKRADTPPSNTSADAQITSSLMATQQHPPGPYGERLTPRGLPHGFPPTHDPTPALRQLSEYARPHVMGQDPSRSIPYSLGGPMPPGADPMVHYRMAAMYPPGSRERLELELQRDKQERDARERELRERELREMEIREIRKQELEMKPPGFDRLPPGANPLDPHLIEMQRRYAAASLGQAGFPPGHIPGVYPPASLASDLLARERERIERLERLSAAERIHAERLAIANDPVLRLQMANHPGGPGGPGGPGAHPSTHTHAHSHTHLHLHQAETAASALLQAQAGIPPGPPGHGHPPPPPPPPSIPGADPLAAVAAAAGGGPGPYLPPSHALPPGHPLLSAAREQEMAYRELLSRPPYSTDPVLAHQVTAALREQQAYREAVGRDFQAQQILSAQAAHHEALQRQIAIERERQLGPHLPH